MLDPIGKTFLPLIAFFECFFHLSVFLCLQVKQKGLKKRSLLTQRPSGEKEMKAKKRIESKLKLDKDISFLRAKMTFGKKGSSMDLD